MKKLLSVLLLAALLCALLVQGAAAELEAEDTTANFAGSFAAEWRLAAEEGEDIGAVLLVTLESRAAFRASWEEDVPDGAETDVPDTWGDSIPQVLTFAVHESVYGAAPGEELAITCTALDAWGLQAGQNYVVRVTETTPKIPDPRTSGAYLPASEVGNWTLEDVLMIDGAGRVYAPVGNYQDLGRFLKGEGETVKEPEGFTSFINANRVNVRAAASTSAKSLGKLNDGDAVTVLGAEGRWVKIAWEGGAAYVWDSYVSVG